MILYIFISHCIIYGDRDVCWFVQARPRPYFFGAGIVGAYFLLAQQNFGTEFSTIEKIWSRSIFDIQTRPRAPWRPTLGEGEAPADLLAGHFLAGFSLGGNFALRIAARAAEAGITLQQTIAVCPVVDPVKTMAAIEQGWWVYEKYFVRKWKRSLKKKLALYPELNFASQLNGMRRLRDFNDYFVPNHTPFNEPEDYFRAYALSPELLSTLSSPAHIIAAKDDPMIIAEDFLSLSGVDKLHIETPRFGGHCGFVKNWRLDSWVDERMLELVQLCRYDKARAQQ